MLPEKWVHGNRVLVAFASNNIKKMIIDQVFQEGLVDAARELMDGESRKGGNAVSGGDSIPCNNLLA